MEQEKLMPILDIPSEDPGMDFKESAKILANLLKNAEPPQITVGVFGGYGSGKTTLMRAIEKELAEEIITIRFNAWRYDHEEHLFLPFLAALIRNEKILVNSPTVVEKCSAALRGIIRGLSIKSVIEFSAKNALEAEKEFLKGDVEKILCGYTDIYNELEKIPFEKVGEDIKERIVIFVDDLDRCVPDKAFALLEAMKSFMDMKGFMFVLGLDPRAIETYVLRKYDKDFCVTAEEYLQKMVQIPVHLPRPTQTDVFNEISKLSTSAKKILKELEALKNFFPCNIRQAKRILNMFQAIIATNDELNLSNPEDEKVVLNPKVLAGLLIIELRWPRAYWALHCFCDDFKNLYERCKSDKQTGIYVKLLKQPKAIDEIKDDEFGKIYGIILKELNYKIIDIKIYLEKLGWPVNIESKLVREKSDD